MIDKEQIQKVSNIISDHKSHSNKDLMFAMDFIQTDFNFNKDKIVELTHHLDKLEVAYKKLLDEYKSRTNT